MSRIQFTFFSDLKSLALPTCILLTITSADMAQRPQRRVMSTRGRGRAPNAASAAEGREYRYAAHFTHICENCCGTMWFI